VAKHNNFFTEPDDSSFQKGHNPKYAVYTTDPKKPLNIQIAKKPIYANNEHKQSSSNL